MRNYEGFLKPYQVAQIKKKYPVGTRIQLDHMEGERDMPDGLCGTVKFVDDQGQLHMRWDNGRSLTLVTTVDDFHILPPQEQGDSLKPEKPISEEPDARYEPMNFYVDYINLTVMTKIDHVELQADYATKEKAYAKSVLNALHQGVQVVYGTEIFDRDTAGGYVLLPGVVQSKDTGELCIALLELDLQSSGEHCATDFLIRYGCISQSEQEMPDDVRKFLRETYGAYDYGYTATLTDDIHVDKSSLPPEMREVLEHFREHEFIPYDPKYHFQGTEAAPEDEGELEHG